jgi:hypothetical protein
MAEVDVKNESPDTPSGESGSSTTGVPKWIRDATSFIALLSTITGVVLSIWGMKEKSRFDAETAKDNLDIVNKQIKAHVDEYDFQARQHENDLAYQKQEHDNEQRIAKEQRLSDIIDGLFSGSANVEGKIDLLASYITPDHQNDAMIANALVAKLDTPQSPAEVATALSVLESLGPAKSGYLITINQNARSRYNEALVSLYWRFLDSRISQVAKGEFSAASRDTTGISPGHRLVDIIALSETDFAHQSYSPSAVFDELYIYATINNRIATRLIGSILPGDENNHRKDNDPSWWNEIQDAVHSQVMGVEAQQRSQFLLAGDTLKKTSVQIPPALLEERKAGQKSTVTMKSCYFGDVIWPSGEYPALDFGNSYLGNSDLTKASLGNATVSSLLQHTRIVKSDPYGRWNTGQLWPLTYVFAVSSSDLTDLKVSPETKLKIRTLQAERKSHTEGAGQ